jgi:hypothetical protein
MFRSSLVALGAALVLALPSSSAAAPRTIRASSAGVSSMGSFLRSGASLSRAKAAFGRPTKVRTVSKTYCRAWWRRLGLTVGFSNFGGGPPCAYGSAQTAKIRGAGARAGWRSGRGLRVGDSTARLRRLYPHAFHRGRAYALARGHSPYGPRSVTWFGAQTRNGKVTSFYLFLGRAGD